MFSAWNKDERNISFCVRILNHFSQITGFGLLESWENIHIIRLCWLIYDSFNISDYYKGEHTL